MTNSTEAATVRSMTRNLRSLPGLRDVAACERGQLADAGARGWASAAKQYLELSQVSQRIGSTEQAKRFARAYGACERRSSRYQRAQRSLEPSPLLAMA